MKKDTSKPLMLYVAEKIYFDVVKIKKNNPNITLIEAIEIFSNSNECLDISNGHFHDKLFKDLEENNYINKETNSKIPQETISLLKVQKDTIIKKLNFKTGTYYTKSSFPLSNSQNAFDLLWRMCESYELWCKETKQDELLTLKIID